jgi:hypothetical protein
LLRRDFATGGRRRQNSLGGRRFLGEDNRGASAEGGADGQEGEEFRHGGDGKNSNVPIRQESVESKESSSRLNSFSSVGGAKPLSTDATPGTKIAVPIPAFL